jgi:hypothetical protein
MTNIPEIILQKSSFFDFWFKPLSVRTYFSNNGHFRWIHLSSKMYIFNDWLLTSQELHTISEIRRTLVLFPSMPVASLEDQGAIQFQGGRILVRTHIYVVSDCFPRGRKYFHGGHCPPCPPRLRACFHRYRSRSSTNKNNKVRSGVSDGLSINEGPTKSSLRWVLERFPQSRKNQTLMLDGLDVRHFISEFQLLALSSG